MIRRVDRRQIELPPRLIGPGRCRRCPGVLGGKFGEMSTFLNYTFQSFNFRKQGARPFYDLVANIAAEQFGHVELVAKTINTMLTGATTTSAEWPGPGKSSWADAGDRQAAPLPRRRPGSAATELAGPPMERGLCFFSGDLVEDFTTTSSSYRSSEREAEGVRDGRHRRAGADRFPARPWRCGSGGVRARGRALTGADLRRCSRRRGSPPRRPRCRPHIKRGEHLKLYRFSAERLPGAGRPSSTGPHPETGEELEVVDEAPEGFAAHRLPGAARSSPRTTRRRRSDRREAPEEDRTAQGADRRGRERQVDRPASRRRAPGKPKAATK